MNERLPPGWRAIKLGELGDWTSGGTPSRSEPKYYGEGVPWVKTGDLSDGPLYEIPESITELGLKNSAAKRLPAGTLLVAMYGATIGKLGLLTFEAATNQACAALLPNGKTADFIPYVFQYLLGQREDLRRIGQGGAQPNISQAILKDYRIPLPPLDEQRLIVAKLEALQERSRGARKSLDTVPRLLEKLRQSILAAAFRGDLTREWRAKNKNVEPATKLLERIRAERRKKWEQDELAKMKAKGKASGDEKWKAKYKTPLPISTTELPKLPGGWCWTTVDELLINGPTNGFSPKSDGAGSGTPTLRLSATTRGYCVLNETTTKRTVEAVGEDEPYWLVPGDLLLQRANAIEYVGVTAIFNGPPRRYIYPDLMMRLRASELLDSRFLWRALSSDVARKFMRERATGTAGNMPKVNGETVRRTPVALPPLEEQSVLLQLLDDADARRQALERALSGVSERLTELERATLAKAFRGELVPQRARGEARAALVE